MDVAWRARVYDTVRRIPSGRVATYGLVALLAGRPGAARAVGNLMLECDDRTVPCHRVVHADGTMGFPGQRERLRREGLRVTARVDLRVCLWTPRLPPPARGGGDSLSTSRSRWMSRKVSPAL